MDNRPIGVFDSGIGGLTVVDALAKRLPNETIYYVGDTARVPYGNKSKSRIQQYALEIRIYDVHIYIYFYVLSSIMFCIYFSLYSICLRAQGRLAFINLIKNSEESLTEKAQKVANFRGKIEIEKCINNIECKSTDLNDAFEKKL